MDVGLLASKATRNEKAYQNEGINDGINDFCCARDKVFGGKFKRALY
jgi:hypothetical protein